MDLIKEFYKEQPALSKQMEYNVGKDGVKTFFKWFEKKLNSNQVQAVVKPEIAELEKKIEGYRKIIQFIINNHWKFGDMEQQLLTKIEKVGKKYDL